jgi:hypothetical protein
VRWTAPSSNGGSASTGHQVRVLDIKGAQVGALHPADATATSPVVTGLTNGSASLFPGRRDQRGRHRPELGADLARRRGNGPGCARDRDCGIRNPGRNGHCHRQLEFSDQQRRIAGDRIVVRALRMSARGTVLAITTSTVRPAAVQQNACGRDQIGLSSGV